MVVIRTKEGGIVPGFEPAEPGFVPGTTIKLKPGIEIVEGVPTRVSGSVSMSIAEQEALAQAQAAAEEAARIEAARIAAEKLAIEEAAKKAAAEEAARLQAEQVRIRQAQQLALRRREQIREEGFAILKPSEARFPPEEGKVIFVEPKKLKPVTPIRAKAIEIKKRVAEVERAERAIKKEKKEEGVVALVKSGDLPSGVLVGAAKAGTAFFSAADIARAEITRGRPLTPEEREPVGEFIGELGLFAAAAPVFTTTAETAKAVQQSEVLFKGTSQSIEKDIFKTDTEFIVKKGTAIQKGKAQAVSAVIEKKGDLILVGSLGVARRFRRGIVFPTGKEKIISEGIRGGIKFPSGKVKISQRDIALGGEITVRQRLTDAVGISRGRGLTFQDLKLSEFRTAGVDVKGKIGKEDVNLFLSRILSKEGETTALGIVKKVKKPETRKVFEARDLAQIEQAKAIVPPQQQLQTIQNIIQETFVKKTTGIKPKPIPKIPKTKPTVKPETVAEFEVPSEITLEVIPTTQTKVEDLGTVFQRLDLRSDLQLLGQRLDISQQEKIQALQQEQQPMLDLIQERVAIQDLIESQSLVQTQIQKAELKPRATLDLFQELSLRSLTKQKPAVPKVPIKPRPKEIPPVFIIPGLPAKKIKKEPVKKVTGYNVRIKKPQLKKEVKVNRKPLPLQKARDLRDYGIDHSLSRRGRVIATKKKIPKTSVSAFDIPSGYSKRNEKKFRTFKKVLGKKKVLRMEEVIEKRRHIGDTQGEIKKLGVLRALKKVKKKKVKRRKK